MAKTTKNETQCSGNGTKKLESRHLQGLDGC